jgi:predicted GNAT family acetyltransferase
MSDRVRNNAAASRFELDADVHTAFAYYSMAGDVITFRHTEVPLALEGRGIGVQRSAALVVAGAPITGTGVAQNR